MTEQLLQPLTDEEYGSLKEKIAHAGRVVVPVIKDRHGDVLDGRHRLRAVADLRAAGHTIPDPPVIVEDVEGDDAEDLQIALNVSRRQMSREQSKELAVSLRKRGWTQARIGKAMGVPQQTISDWLNTGIGNEKSFPATVTNSRGQERPATYRRRAEESPQQPEREPENHDEAANVETVQDAVVAEPSWSPSEEVLGYEDQSAEEDYQGEGRGLAQGLTEPIRQRALPTISTSPARPGGRLGRPGEYLTLSVWNEMTAVARQELLAPASSDKKFNSQGDNENIEWALWSWNPVTGCEHNCPYCYARDIANRFYESKFEPTVWPERLAAPKNTPFPEEKAGEWMGHKNVFTCSMADLFGRWVPREWIDAVLQAIRSAPQWNFLFLTKFPIRMAEFDFPDNAWVGTSVDCQARVANAERAFRKVKAKVKWLSCEPLIEPLHFSDLGAFQWVVLGGASKSSQTPEWQPPRQWLTAIEAEADRLGVKVYEKTNIGLARIRQYPGVDVVLPEAPAGLRYLAKVEGAK